MRKFPKQANVIKKKGYFFSEFCTFKGIVVALAQLWQELP